MTIWTLHGTIRRGPDAWTELAALLADWHAAWADLDGMHVQQPMPSTLPVTSHLWAWTPGTWFRARVDGDAWWGSVLSTRAWGPGPLFPDNTRDEVDVVIDRIRSWAPDDGRIQQKQLVGDQVPESMWQFTTIGPRPVAFIGAEPTWPDS
jgi:hypothetical protein